MSNSIPRRGLLANVLVVGLGTAAAAQQAAKPQGFPTADAAAAAFTEAVRRNDAKALAAILGPSWRDLLPGEQDQGDREVIHDSRV